MMAPSYSVSHRVQGRSTNLVQHSAVSAHLSFVHDPNLGELSASFILKVHDLAILREALQKMLLRLLQRNTRDKDSRVVVEALMASPRVGSDRATFVGGKNPTLEVGRGLIVVEVRADLPETTAGGNIALFFVIGLGGEGRQRRIVAPLDAGVPPANGKAR